MALQKKNLPLEFIENKQHLNIALLIMHVYVAVVNTDLPLLIPFQKLLKNPNDFENLFIPTMPEDEEYEVSSSHTTHIERRSSRPSRPSALALQYIGDLDPHIVNPTRYCTALYVRYKSINFI